MAKKTRLTATTGRHDHPRKRAEQQRALTTRASILNAAIAEFAERGFDGASIRAIADRLGLQHPLITYHYRSKDILWRAAAEHDFAQIRTEWDISASEDSDLSPLARLRQEDTTLFRYTVGFPEFHRFMRQETLTNNPRLKWVAETVLGPTRLSSAKSRSEIALKRQKSEGVFSFASAVGRNALRLLRPTAARSLDGASRDAADEAVEEKIVRDRHRDARDQRRRHQFAPVEDIAANEVGRDPQGDRLFLRRGDKRQGIDELLHRQRECKNDHGQYRRRRERQHRLHEGPQHGAPVDDRGFLDFARYRFEESHQ